MKKLLLSLVAAACLLSFPAMADDRLRPNTSINELTSLPATSVTTSDFVLGYDASALDWVKLPAAQFGVGGAASDLTAVSTLTVANCGSTYFLNSATEFATTLPTATAGCSFRFIVKAAPSGASYTVVTPAGADLLIGGINELEVDTGDDGPYDNNGDTITFVNGVSVVGDYVYLISDGTSWYLHGQANADGGVTVSGT